MNNNLLYLNSSNELIQSRNYQSQISQKEFEIRLIDINNNMLLVIITLIFLIA